ncbi:MAG: hypothetical protein HY073_03295, partial [Deltaproteobacteria bacterium]|nr:hypothetical protein [Deltaproteobacteria bacterium]
MKIIFWALLLSLFSFSVTFAKESPRITAISIQNGSRISVDQIRQVLPIHENDPYDPMRVEAAVTALKKWGRFQEIRVEKTETMHGVTLKFILTEGYLIGGIDIYHGYPYLSIRLRRILSVHTGDLYDVDLAKEQAQKLATFFDRAGYEGTTVDFRPRQNDQKMTVELVYSIRKGKRYRLGKVHVQGNKFFPYGYFVSQLNPLRLYEPTRFHEKIDKMRRDYQQKGYLRARVRMLDLGQDEVTRTVNPSLQVNEGKHATLVFRGNQRVSLVTFKKILPLYSEGGYGDYELQASRQVMADYYHRLGFQEFTVKTETQDLGNDHLKVIFLIQEGPQTHVKKIQIEGHEEVPTDRIKDNLLTKENKIFSDGFYDSRLVNQDVQNLPKILQDQGALEGKALGQDTSLNKFH